MAEHHLVLVLVAGRSDWHRALAGVVDGGFAPLRLQRCLGVEELLAVASGAGCPGTAVVDGSALGVGRDLIGQLRQLGFGTLVVDGRRSERHWTTLGADAAAPADAPADELVRLILGIARAHAKADHGDPRAEVAAWERLVAASEDEATSESHPRGGLVCVLGPGGTSTSTVARALSEAAVAHFRRCDVLLADFARCPHQALLHGVGRAKSGLEELMDCCRLRTPEAEELATLTVPLHEHGYVLLPGRRSASAWASWGPFARRAALDALCQAYRVVVADCDGDLEGSSECGSPDVEQRHALQRDCVEAADLVVVVGRDGLSGLASLADLLAGVRRLRPDDARIGVVLRAGSAGRALGRASRRVVARRAADGDLPDLVLPPIALPEADVERSVLDTSRLPQVLVRACAPLIGVLDERLAAVDRGARPGLVGVGVTPGALGTSQRSIEGGQRQPWRDQPW